MNLRKGVSYCLSASPGKIIERLTGDDQEPLIGSEDQERIITDLLNDRMPAYQRADYIIKTDLLSPKKFLEESWASSVTIWEINQSLPHHFYKRGWRSHHFSFFRDKSMNGFPKSNS